jgi:adenine-specific DNA-methyltransferase
MATLNFKGKPFVQNLHLGVQFHQLVPVPKKSLNTKPDLGGNLIIHGDNLKALKSLMPLYAGKVKCVYIDPPYNTGNESWAYNDNVTSPMMQEWLGKVVDRDDLTRHDKWLCMMMPRLKLLRDLLSNDGAIFVSMDDTEIQHLRPLMDEVFGELNFVATFVWKRRASSALAENLVSQDHEYVVCYKKSAAFAGFRGNDKDYRSYANPDRDPEGDWTLGDLTVGMTKEQRPNQFYPLVDPKTKKTFQANPHRVWAFVKESMQKEIKAGRVIFPENAENRPMVKRYRKNLKSEVNPISTWIKGNGSDSGDDGVVELQAGLNSEATKSIQAIFGSKAFDYAKPLSLIRALIGQVCDDGEIALDSFAGSGTTAHAVLELNREDGNHRRFILVECEDYADKVTAERVKQVIRGVPKAKDIKLREGLNGSFTCCELGPPLDVAKLLDGKDLPSYEALARYVFHTATGKTFVPNDMESKDHFIGQVEEWDLYLWYVPEADKLKDLAFTLDDAEALGRPTAGRRRMVFAPMKYVDQEDLDALAINFVHLPYEIYERIP